MILPNEFLSADGLYLRGLQPEDAAGNYLKWFNDPEVCFGNSHGVFPVNQKSLVEYIDNSYKSNQQLVFAMIENKNHTHIGNISLQGINWINRTAEFAIFLGEKSYWGKGLAVQAGNLIVNHGFSDMNLNRIYCGTFSNNQGMIKLAKALKMTQEGVRRKAIYKNGIYLDMIEFGVLRDEFL
ncbi:Acetyltransferase [Leptospira biflexa serovar Patoc strain 'Patoc 1 (Ames)']|uniref:Putative acetyltransferase n=1 Tax=Leptospira biflexa serovar Patoc (strain Patoc 1 / ATCC 23582 / Paris) TaxID=456481 RepID=B0SSN4_LEPBP|nr:GNAT family protein [Leptospira biflexa]ABZ94469.1 Acetyltransferase [Leptospira biflexa serovar Patoc strain 'Patoc 1 (Ames)']ABZ98124.1 Putative acetyltransferase [Leptospira biflexa serovar Patoc strain 'Patoc 1 (Paris)']